MRGEGRCGKNWRTLADVGGRIVAESIAGFMLADPESFVHTTWRPTPPIAPLVGPFRMQEFLKFAGVV